MTSTAQGPQGVGEWSDIVLGLGTIPGNGVHETVAIGLQFIVIAVAGETTGRGDGGSLAVSRYHARREKACNRRGCCCHVRVDHLTPPAACLDGLQSVVRVVFQEPAGVLRCRR